MKKHKTKLIIGGIVVAVVVVMLVSRPGSADTWGETQVSCLPGGHQNAVTHIHANLSVFVDGNQQVIPANTGIDNMCMAEVHTHDRSGEIHIESVDRNARRTLADFFAVWDELLEREGYDRSILVNGQPASPGYIFRDGDVIEVRFERIDDGAAGATTTDDGVGGVPDTPEAR